ncbi:MAG: ribonuclease III [Lentisphaeria bacterium]|nr:ribonuclease III [Lentisphaeria bacterium]
MDSKQKQIEDRIGHVFAHPALLEEALTHPSYAIERRHPPPDNQRLEFLGDAVLQLVVSEMLFSRLPEGDEGILTRVRSAVAKEETLVGFARELALGEALLLGNGEIRTGGVERASNLGDAFEAVLAALYLDGGLPPVRALCERLLAPFLKDVESLLAEENPKGALQELTQRKRHLAPTYEVMGMEGPVHDPCFTVRVLLDGTPLATATGNSRRTAERNAATLALEKLRADEEEQNGE